MGVCLAGPRVSCLSLSLACSCGTRYSPASAVSLSHPCVTGRPVDRQTDRETDKIQIQILARAHVRHSRCVRVSWKNQIPLFSRRCSSLLAVRIVVCPSVAARLLATRSVRFVFVCSCSQVCVPPSCVACASCRATPTPGTKSNSSSSNADCRWRCPARTRCCRHRRRRCDTSNRYFCVCFRIRFQFSHVLLRVQTRCFRFVLLLPSTHKALKGNSNSNNNIGNISATTSTPERANQTFELLHILTLITRWIKLLKH